jgi:hypothetical protein
MVEVYRYGKMVRNMRDIGRMTWPMARAALFTLMEMFTRVNGLMTRLMEEELTFIWMVLSTLETGEKINNMASELKRGLMGLVMRATMSMGRSMEPVLSNGLMVACTLGNSIIITFMGKECILGPMVENTKENGETIKCMAEEHSNGLMEESTWENTLMIKSKAMVNSFGLMVALTREICLI